MRSPLTTVLTLWLLQSHLLVLRSSASAASAATGRDVMESRPRHRVIMKLLELIHDQELNPTPKNFARVHLHHTLEVENEEDSEGTEHDSDSEGSEEEQYVSKGIRLGYITPEVQKESYSEEKRFYSDW